MATKCPNCSAPIMHYVNSNGSETDYCEYCRYRHDYPAPEATTGAKVVNMVGNFLGSTFGVQVTPQAKLSPIEIMDREKEEQTRFAAMSPREQALYERQKAFEQRMRDREQAIYEKQKAIEQRREAASRKSKKTFNPKTGMYE